MPSPSRRNSACRLLLVLLGLLVMALAGCKKGSPPPPASAGPQASKPLSPAGKAVQKPVSSAVVSPTAVNQFDFSTKKDPFKPFVAVKVATPADAKQLRRDALPILSYDVSQFRLIGIVADPRGNKALVVDPGGKAYVIRPGMTIGKNDGKVAAITLTGVEVVEQFRDDSGKIRRETIRIPLLRKP